MRSLLLTTLSCLFFLNIKAQDIDKSTDPRFGKIPPETESKIKERVEYEILWYLAVLCPEVDFEEFVVRGYENQIILSHYEPKGIFLDSLLPARASSDAYKMILEVVRWPEGNPKLYSYLVKKQGLRFTNGVDTVALNICNDYFDYDENYLVYYTGNGYLQMVSGNVFQDIFYPFINKNLSVRWSEAYHLIHYRMAQFKGSGIRSFPHGSEETEDYFQFRVDKSLLSPSSVMVRVPKSDPFNTLEIFYYTNDTAVTKGDIFGLYEVKRTLRSNPETYEETLPVITKMDRQFINNKIRNESKEWSKIVYFIEMPPIIQQETVTIIGQIDSVYIDDDPIIIVIDTEGRKTEIPYEAVTDYLIKGQSKREVLVKENREIIYKEGD